MLRGADRRTVETHRDGDNGAHESAAQGRTLQLMRLELRRILERPLRLATRLARAIFRDERPFEHRCVFLARDERSVVS